MKKYLAIALAALLLVGSLASCVQANPDAIDNYTPEVDYIVTEQGTFYFEEAEGETAILVNYNGKATRDDHVVIPATFNDRAVTVIGEKAFYSLASVVEVTIPDTVVKIDKYAFARCTELTAINLPEGLLEISDMAFAECDKLETVNLGKSLVTIGEMAFANCTALKNIALPATLKTIDEGAFWSCTALTSLEFPASLENIGTLAYYNCTGIAEDNSIKFNSGKTAIGDYAFVTEDGNNVDKIDLTGLKDTAVFEYVHSILDVEEAETEASTGENETVESDTAEEATEEATEASTEEAAE